MVLVQLHRRDIGTRRHGLDGRDTAITRSLAMRGVEGGVLGLVEVLLSILVQGMRGRGGRQSH